MRTPLVDLHYLLNDNLISPFRIDLMDHVSLCLYGGQCCFLSIKSFNPDDIPVIAPTGLTARLMTHSFWVNLRAMDMCHIEGENVYLSVCRVAWDGRGG